MFDGKYFIAGGSNPDLRCRVNNKSLVSDDISMSDMASIGGHHPQAKNIKMKYNVARSKDNKKELKKSERIYNNFLVDTVWSDKHFEFSNQFDTFLL